jgi:hypothetical protein
MPNTLRSQTLRIASELPQGDPTRRDILAALSNKEAWGSGRPLWNALVAAQSPLFKKWGAPTEIFDARGKNIWSQDLQVSRQGDEVVVSAPTLRQIKYNGVRGATLPKGVLVNWVQFEDAFAKDLRKKYNATYTLYGYAEAEKYAQQAMDGVYGRLNVKLKHSVSLGISLVGEGKPFKTPALSGVTNVSFAVRRPVDLRLTVSEAAELGIEDV